MKPRFSCEYRKLGKQVSILSRAGAIVERGVNDRHFAGSRFDSSTANCIVIYLGKKIYAKFSYGPSSFPVVVVQFDEKVENGTHKKS